MGDRADIQSARGGPLRRRLTLLAAVALAVACALVWSGAATAQQRSEAPGWAQPAEETPQTPSPGGDGDRGAAADDEPFPLVQVVLALALLSLAVLHGVGVLARRRGWAESVRERIGDLRAGPPLTTRRPAFAGRSNPAAFAARGAGPRPKPPPAAGGGEERADVPAERAEAVRKHDVVDGKPAKPPPRPKGPPVAVMKPVALKPPPDEPLQAAQPASSVEQPRAAKSPSPAAGGEERADVPAERAEAVRKHDVVDGKLAKPSPKPKGPPAPTGKPVRPKPPPTSPLQAAELAASFKPPRAGKPTPSAKTPPAATPPPAVGGKERADVPAERVEAVAKHDVVVGKPAEAPPKPKRPRVRARKPAVPKPPSAKPPRAARPTPSAKPPPAAGEEERADVPAERVEAVAKHDVVAGKPADAPPKPKRPRVAARKPVAPKPPSAKPPRAAKPTPSAKTPPAAKPPLSAKPPRAAKAPPPAEPLRAAKPTQPAKPPRAAKPPSRAKAAPATERPKPASPTRKPPAQKKSRAERHPRSEQQPPVVPDERDGMLTCSIFWWRDGPVADFYALATGRQGRPWVVERSPRFEWLAGDDLAAAREAHAVLVEALVTTGWRQAGTEGVWYRQRFERPFAEGS